MRFVLPLPMASDRCIENGANSFALVLPSWDVGFGDLAHEGSVHQRQGVVALH